MLMATLGRGSTDADAIAGTINFFVGLLDKNDKAYIEARLMDRDDPFSKVGATRIQEFLENLAEVWSGNPTQPLSVSTLSPPSDGPKSTPTTPLLTS